MSVIFSSDFNGDLSEWSDHTALFRRYLGCGGTKCWACCSILNDGGGIANKTFPVYRGTGAIRGQSAIVHRSDVARLDSLSGSVGFSLRSTRSGSGPLGVGFSYNGTDPVGVIGVAGNSLDSREISTVLLPLDGTWFSWQVGFTLYLAPFPLGGRQVEGDIRLTINNTLVAAWSGQVLGKYYIDYPIDGVDVEYDTVAFGTGLFVSQTDISPPPFFYGTMTALDNVEVDDAPAVVDYPACAGVPLYITGPFDNSCATRAPTHPTSMVIDCDTTQVTIEGTGFNQGAIVTLEGPHGETIDHTILSITPTAIVLQLTGEFVSGTYCVTVTNGL